MEREILFRGKAINRDTGYKNGDWVYGLVTRLYDERFENLPAEMTNADGVSGIEVDYKTIGQYTELKDTFGEKVFEGDYIFCEPDEEIGVVKFDEGEFVGVFGDVIDNNRFADLIACCHVIGNVYDNPELLK